MTRVYAYLTFSGNCREAMLFYRQCLGGTLSFQTAGDTPLAGKLPGSMKKCVLQGRLQNGHLLLTGTDMVGDNGLIKGNSVSLLLNCSTQRELNRLYKKLSAGATQKRAPEKNYFNVTTAGLTDKFGQHWVLQCNK